MPTTLADRAIRWYDGAARDLPWRRPSTSVWGVLVSEVMLQQTPAARVAPVWTDWMRRWPTPAGLAAEPAGEAIRAWGRLGYPRRALRLHSCALVLVAQHGGAVPKDLSELLALPGVGAYTARAVATFAYGQRHPVVDTNVRRLIARACHGLPDGGPMTTAADLATTERLLPLQPARAARASVAFMELGAVMCGARLPACGGCPLSLVCAWRLAGRPGLAGRPSRRPQRYVGTDRQVRGLLLAAAREAPMSHAAANAIWPDPVQRRRALASLLADGLLVDTGGRYALPGLA